MQILCDANPGRCAGLCCHTISELIPRRRIPHHAERYFARSGMRCREVCTGVDRGSGRGHNTIQMSMISPRVGTIRLASGPQERRAGGGRGRSRRGRSELSLVRTSKCGGGRRLPVTARKRRGERGGILREVFPRNGQPRATEGNRGQPGATGGNRHRCRGTHGPGASTPKGSKPAVRGIAFKCRDTNTGSASNGFDVVGYVDAELPDGEDAPVVLDAVGPEQGTSAPESIDQGEDEDRRA